LGRRTAPLVYIDVATDIRCPFSHVALCRLRRAIGLLGATARVELRYHPVYLDPAVSEEGEDLGAYLLREHGVTPEEVASASYPLNLAAAELGFAFHPKRRVLNTARAFCALALAAAEGGGAEVRLLLTITPSPNRNRNPTPTPNVSPTLTLTLALTLALALQ
jgi:predicted DsbA family dithiol-disulfide isomerase